MIQFEYILLLILSSFLIIYAEDLDPETVQKRKDCIEKCGGGRHIKAVTDKVELVCISNWLGYKVETHTSCLVECMGGTPDENQLKCLSEYCKLGWNRNYFCTESKGDPIEMNKCDTVANGEAKFTRDCDPNRDVKGMKKFFKGHKWRDAKAQSRYNECREKCGGKEHIKEASEDDGTCFRSDYGPGTPCIVDCRGNSPDPDETDEVCLARYCEASPDQFCSEANGVHIKKEECGTLVREGKAKMYGNCVKGS